MTIIAISDINATLKLYAVIIFMLLFSISVHPLPENESIESMQDLSQSTTDQTITEFTTESITESTTESTTESIADEKLEQNINTYSPDLDLNIATTTHNSTIEYYYVDVEDNSTDINSTDYYPDELELSSMATQNFETVSRECETTTATTNAVNFFDQFAPSLVNNAAPPVLVISFQRTPCDDTTTEVNQELARKESQEDFKKKYDVLVQLLKKDVFQELKKDGESAMNVIDKLKQQQSIVDQITKLESLKQQIKSDGEKQMRSSFSGSFDSSKEQITQVIKTVSDNKDRIMNNGKSDEESKTENISETKIGNTNETNTEKSIENKVESVDKESKVEKAEEYETREIDKQANNKENLNNQNFNSKSDSRSDSRSDGRSNSNGYNKQESQSEFSETKTDNNQQQSKTSGYKRTNFENGKQSKTENRTETSTETIDDQLLKNGDNNKESTTKSSQTDSNKIYNNNNNNKNNNNNNQMSQNDSSEEIIKEEEIEETIVKEYTIKGKPNSTKGESKSESKRKAFGKSEKQDQSYGHWSTWWTEQWTEIVVTEVVVTEVEEWTEMVTYYQIKDPPNSKKSKVF